jgi:acetyl/propionyl-CoA carboxylase alpha subunit
MPHRVRLRAKDREFTADVLDPERVVVSGTELIVKWTEPRRAVVGGHHLWVVGNGDARWVYHDGCVYLLEHQRDDAPRRRSGARGGGAATLSAPMPATIRRINVAVGDVVARGDTLIVLEAMKMELPVRANADGVVSAVLCTEGELVQPGLPLIELDEKSGA